MDTVTVLLLDTGSKQFNPKATDLRVKSIAIIVAIPEFQSPNFSGAPLIGKSGIMSDNWKTNRTHLLIRVSRNILK